MSEYGWTYEQIADMPPMLQIRAIKAKIPSEITFATPEDYIKWRTSLK